jgi:hypothetical protein
LLLSRFVYPSIANLGSEVVFAKLVQRIESEKGYAPERFMPLESGKEEGKTQKTEPNNDA